MSQHEPLTSNKSAGDLRELTSDLRTKPVALSSLIRPMQTAADELDRLTAELADMKARRDNIAKDHQQFVEWAEPQIVTHGEDRMTIDRLTAEVAELRRVTKSLVKAFRAPYPFAEQGRAAQDAWAVAREDSLLNAVAALGEQP